MYSFHAWFVLAESTTEIDNGSLSEKVEHLRAIVREKLRTFPEDPVGIVNVNRIFQCSGSYNHRGDRHDNLLSIVNWISNTLPGSHGVVYWSDDEDAEDREQYKIIALARGEYRNLVDQLFPAPAPFTD